MAAKTPKPDEFGRIRVRDEETGDELTINASAFAHGKYVVVDEDATARSGDPVPVKPGSPAKSGANEGSSK